MSCAATDLRCAKVPPLRHSRTSPARARTTQNTPNAHPCFTFPRPQNGGSPVLPRSRNPLRLQTAIHRGLRPLADPRFISPDHWLLWGIVLRLRRVRSAKGQLGWQAPTRGAICRWMHRHSVLPPFDQVTQSRDLVE